MLDAVSAALEAPGKAAEDSSAATEAQQPEPEPVVTETQQPEPDPVVTEIPQAEPAADVAETARPEPEPVVAEAPQPEPRPVVADIPQPPPTPVVPPDAVEEAKAAMWRRRMKVKSAADEKDESQGEPKPASGGDGTATESAGGQDTPQTEDSPETAAEGEKKSPHEVDVVALAREFSGLFGDEGGEG